MLQKEETLELQDFIKKKFPGLADEEIEEISHQLMELGVFLVQLQIKKHFNPPKTQAKEVLECATQEPP